MASATTLDIPGAGALAGDGRSVAVGDLLARAGGAVDRAGWRGGGDG